MEISDLINIGRLKFSLKGENKSKLLLNLKPEFQHLLPKLEKVFLIFKDHRVRYGTIKKIKIVGDNQAVLDFEDQDLVNEILKEDQISVYLDETEINSLDKDNVYYDPIGMKVIWENEKVAEITDFFFNGAHYVYELEMYDKRKILIPDVDSFVIFTDISNHTITVKDLNLFLD